MNNNVVYRDMYTLYACDIITIWVSVWMCDLGRIVV